MEIEPSKKRKQSEIQLPYEPIKFVYTETIGSVLQKFKEIVDPYVWTYEDILEPRPKASNHFIYYYLFHIAPVYNWLRKLDSQILKKYIDQSVKPFSNSKVNKTSPLDFRVFNNQMQHYVSQWEIVKICTSAKVRVLGSKTQEESTLKLNKKLSPIQNISKTCKHLIKKQKFVSNYTLNNMDPSDLVLECQKIFCSECEQQITFRTQILKYPFAPYFNRFYGKQFTINDKNAKYQYQLVLVYTPQKIYLKTSAGVWYEVTQDKTLMISFDRIETKTGVVFVYQQTTSANKILTKALPIKTKVSSTLEINKFSQQADESSHQQISKQTYMQKRNQIKQSLINYIKSDKRVNTEANQMAEQKEQQQVLQDISKNPLPIVLNKKTTDRKLFKTYKKTVEGLLPKQKQKDEYQKNYDKGKTKKIHKNRQQFKTANFFNLYKELKGKLPQPKSDKYPNEQGRGQNQGQNKHRDDGNDSDDDFKDRKPERRNNFQQNRFNKGFKNNQGGNGKFDNNRNKGKFENNRNNGKKFGNSDKYHKKH